MRILILEDDPFIGFDLQAIVDENRFRLDLYYRVSPIVIEVPPLRQRREDIPALVQHFLRDVADRHGRRMPEVTGEALDFLSEQPWPGNARQLRHAVERAFLFAENDRVTTDVLTRFADQRPVPPETVSPGVHRSDPKTLRDVVGQTELELVRAAMERCKGNKKRVARELGISRTYLYKILGEERDRFGAP